MLKMMDEVKVSSTEKAKTKKLELIRKKRRDLSSIMLEGKNFVEGLTQGEKFKLVIEGKVLKVEDGMDLYSYKEPYNEEDLKPKRRQTVIIEKISNFKEKE